MKTPVPATFALLFLAGCSSSEKITEPPETSDTGYPAAGATTRPTMPEYVPKYPWEPGYRPAEELEIERARNPAKHVVSDDTLNRAIRAMNAENAHAAIEEQHRKNQEEAWRRQQQAETDARLSKKKDK